jgi:hypothetical protein
MIIETLVLAAGAALIAYAACTVTGVGRELEQLRKDIEQLTRDRS